jgi:NTP pyrophosphatase (non-canonical NTP hydrolase)
MKLTNDMCDIIFINEVPLPLKQYIIAVIQEQNAATEKHPNWPADDIHGAAIVAEEAGELVRAALQSTYENGRTIEMHKEAIQTAAMALRFLMNMPINYSVYVEK